MEQFSFLCDLAKESGFTNAGLITIDRIPFDPVFRKACEANQCGKYGKCWTCPPSVGPIEELIARAKKYPYAIVYQTIGEIEDSYDFEGMMAVAANHNKNTRDFIEKTAANWKGNFLHLSAGGCHNCERCSKLDEEPCRFPDKALASLEAYGVAVSQLAPRVNMKYINGVNTVTYFGMCLFEDAVQSKEETK
ncbi:MAG: DUF2284 domain-containing protein [Candidatus Merdivicinus sp.]